MSEAQKKTTDAYRRNWHAIWGKPQLPEGAIDVTKQEPTERPFKHVHNWCATDNELIDRCSVCGEERA